VIDVLAELRPPHQINRRQRLRSRHVGAGLQHDPDRFLGLPLVVLTRSLSIGQGLPDDVFEVRVHTGMRARSGAKEKPRREDGAHSVSNLSDALFFLRQGLDDLPVFVLRECLESGAAYVAKGTDCKGELGYSVIA